MDRVYAYSSASIYVRIIYIMSINTNQHEREPGFSPYMT